MSFGAVVDVAIGLIFIYLLLGLIGCDPIAPAPSPLPADRPPVTVSPGGTKPDLWPGGGAASGGS